MGEMGQRTLAATSCAELLRLSMLRKKAVKAGLWPHAPETARLRVAVIGGCTLFPFSDILEHHLEAFGMACQLWVGSYDNYAAEILGESTGLRDFKPEVTVFLPASRRCVSTGSLADPVEIHRSSAETHVKELLGLCRALNEATGSEVVLTNYLLPGRMDPGPFRARSLGSPWAFRKWVNLELGLRAPAYVQICDVEHLGCRVGNLNAFDDRAWFETKQPFAPDMTGLVAREAALQIRSLKRGPKKVLVMDLDNTLWGGVLADDGLEGIELGDTSPRGEAYKAFQKHVKALMERGVLLAVCSKNESTLAVEPFERHPDMVLKRADIIAFKANWKPKPENLVEIAKELNLGLDSLVFVDDNPAEIDIVRKFLPEVEAVLLGDDPSAFVGILEDSRFFEPHNLTREDATRVDQYRQEQARQQFCAGEKDIRSYLCSLEMHASIEPFQAVDVPRLAQLINKTNQFNLTNRRRAEGEVAALVGDPRHPAFSVRLWDRFGDYGLIQILIGEVKDNALHIDTWLMSCRVLKRGVEALAINECVRLARQLNLGQVIGRYIPTSKNMMVSSIFLDMGFRLVPGTQGEVAEYELEVSDYHDQKHEISIKSRS